MQPVHRSLRTEPLEPATSSCTAALPSSRQLAGLPLLFLWASESDVRHFGSSYGLPKATLGILARLQTLPSAFGLLLHRSLTAALPSSRQLAGLPLLFLWASEGDVRHFGPASNASQRLWPTPASQPCLRQAGDRLQTLPSAFKPYPAPLAYSCTAALPSSRQLAGVPLLFLWASESDVRQLAGVPLLFLWASESDVRHFGPASNAPQRLQTLPSAFGLLLHRSLALFSAAGRPASESDVMHFGPPSNPPQRLQTLPSDSCTAALPSSRQLAGLPLLFLWASESDVRHFGPASNAFRLLLRRSLACVRREPGEGASGTCSPCTAALELSLWNLPPPPASQPCPLLGSWQACLFSSYGLPKATLGILARLQTLPSAFGLLLHRSLACVRRETAFKPSRSLACVRREPGEGPGASGTSCHLGSPQTLLGSWQACLFSSYGLPKATLGILDHPQTLLGSWSSRPASSVLMGFRKRR